MHTITSNLIHMPLYCVYDADGRLVAGFMHAHEADAYRRSLDGDAALDAAMVAAVNAEIAALLDSNPWTIPAVLCEGCEGECGNTAPSAYYCADRERFMALCDECAPVPFTVVS